jgi:hypothetical protein
MKHLNEEDLIEHYYTKGESAVAGQHLESCAECAQAYAALKGDLAKMEFAEPPIRDAAYGKQVWQSIAPSLLAYEARRRGWLRGGPGRALSYAAACALLVVCAFIAGRQWEHRHIPAVAANNPAPARQIEPKAAQPREHVVVVVLGDHLDRSERLLVELKHADADSDELVAPMRDEARNLLAANRVCRQKAEQADDPALASTLDLLDHLLAELANQPDGLNTVTLTRLQDEMKADGLLFEVRVLRSRIPDKQADKSARHQGGTI